MNGASSITCQFIITSSNQEHEYTNTIYVGENLSAEDNLAKDSLDWVT